MTIGTLSLATVILKVEFPATLLNPQFSLHVNERSILQLINGLSSDLQKLLKYFSGTTIFTPSFFFLFAPSATVLPIRFDLYLKDVELLLVKLIFSIISSLLNCHKLPEVSEQLSLYTIKLNIGIVILICSASSIKVSFISVLHFLNGAQFLNATFVSSPASATAIFPVTKTYALEYLQRLDPIDFVKNFIGFWCE